MTELGKCVACQTELPEGAPGNRCPKCLLGLALEEFEDKENLLPERVHFGDFELIAEIARGGMGVVYRARQKSLNRIVALKLILSGQFASKQEILRFRAEAESAANLRHPNIVAIYETGESKGQHFFAMEYVPGRNLADMVRDGPLPAQRAARYLEIVARAIHYAHEQGTLHRDLKPSNVLIDAHDQPRVTDFGLAKKLRGDFDLTVTGQALGSPNFMPPEQTGGKNSVLTPAADVYGIGAILYHLLTGRPPFQAATIQEVLRELHEKEPVAPRLLNASIPLDLQTICLKCLEKDPAQRFASAQELADELGRFLRDEPIHSRPIGRAERLGRWCRRKPLVASLSAAVIIAIATGLAGMAWQGRARARALVQTRRLLYASDMNGGQEAWNSANTEVLRSLLKQHQPKPGEEDLRGFEWRLLWRWQRDDDRSVLFPHENVNRICYSADGTFIATLNQFQTPGHLLRVWRADDPHPSAPIAEFKHVTAMAFSPQGHLLAFSVQDQGLHLWDAASRRLLARLGNVPSMRFVKFCDDGSKLAGADTNGLVSIWNLPTGEPFVQSKNLGATRGLAFSPDAQYVAVAGENGVRLWEVSTDRVYADVRCEPIAELATCEFSPDGRTLAIMMDHEVRYWNVQRREWEFSLTGENRCVNAAFSRDGSRLISGGWAGAYLWNLKTRASAPASRTHKNEVSGVAFAPDGLHVAMATPRGVWVESLNANDMFEQFDTGWPIKGLSFTPDSQILAVGTQGGLALRSLATAGERVLLKNHPSSTYALAFSPDGLTLASGSDDNLVRLWDVATGTIRRTLGGHSGWIRAVAFSPDGRWFASSEDGGSNVRVWNAAGEFQKAIRLQSKGGARTLCFSPDGKYLAVGARSGEMSLWSVVSWKPVAEHAEHARLTRAAVTIHSSLFFDGGHTLATADNQGWIVLWDVESRCVVRSWQAHSSGIRTLALSSDGRTLASGGYGQELILWHVPTGRAMLRLKHPAPIFSAAFSDDGTVLATGGDDQTVRLWRAPFFKEIEPASVLSTRSR